MLIFFNNLQAPPSESSRMSTLVLPPTTHNKNQHNKRHGIENNI
jgi:hypothetical protein